MQDFDKCKITKEVVLERFLTSIPFSKAVERGSQTFLPPISLPKAFINTFSTRIVVCEYPYIKKRAHFGPVLTSISIKFSPNLPQPHK